MPDLPEHKVGLISCSGEEIPEGTLARIATRLVLESLRPGQTVTICLPLFLAGGEGERAFARVHPTITIDGCGKLCAKRGTEAHSGQVAASIVVSDVIERSSLQPPRQRRHLDESELRLADILATEIAAQVDRVIGERSTSAAGVESVPVQCACQSQVLPTREIQTTQGLFTVVALDPLLDRFIQQQRAPDETMRQDILEQVKIYNYVAPEREVDIAAALLREYEHRLSHHGGDHAKL